MTKFRIETGWKSALLTCALLFSGGLSGAVSATAQAPVVTTRTTLSTTLSGVAGKIAANKFGDVFQGSTFSDTVYEFPANGAAPIALFKLNTAYTGTGAAVGGVAVDANQNLYVTALFLTASSSSDSAIYELPYVNGSYPATYTLSAPVAACGANPTTVCAWGNFLSGIDGYYYGAWDFAIDGNGAGYLVTDYDGSSSSTNSGNNIYTCSAACEAHTSGAGPTIVAANLPHPVLSLAVDSAGDVFYADGSSHVYEVPAGTSTSVALGGSFNQTIGVSVDHAGNLYVTDCGALYELPLTNGSHSSVAPFEIVPLPGASTRTSGGGYNGGGVAVDREGNLYAATGFANLYKYSRNSGVFAAAVAPSGTSALTFNVVFNSTVTSTGVTATGAQAGDFQISASTCAAGGTPGSTCTFLATFQPAGVGLRRAGLIVSDSAGDSVPLALTGVGQGAGITVDPGAVTTVGTGFKAAAGVAVDTSGNLFVADSSAGTVYEYPAGTQMQTAIGTGFSAPTGLAVDGGGNLYVADAGGAGASGRILEIPLVAGAYSSASQTTIATGLGTLGGLFVDSYGTVFAADSTNKDVFSIPRAQFGQPGGATFGTGLTAPSDVAVDANGTLYIADPPANQVVLISAEGAQSTAGTGLSAPTGVAVDASGSVLIADQGNQRLVRVPNEAGVLNPNDQIAISTTISAPYAVRLDASGNLAVTDNNANVLVSVNRAQGSIVFSNVNVNTTSGAQPAYLSSEGTSSLGLSSPLYTAPTSPFSLMQGTPACTPGSTLAAGFSCQLSAAFSPTAPGPQSITTPFSVTALNTASPSLTLTGSGLQLTTPTVTLQQTSPAGQPQYGQSVVFTATVSGAVGTPAGNVVLFVDGSQQPGKPLSAGTATFTLSGLSGGQHTLYAQYPGDGVNYAAATSTPSLVIMVAQATSSTTVAIATTAIAPLSAAVGDPITFSSTLLPGSPGFFSGTVNYVSGGVTLASAPVVAGTGGTYTASITTTNVPAGNYQVTAVYTGNANYISSISTNSVGLQVVAISSEITLTPASTSITASAGKSGSTVITLGSLAGFQGGVDFKCTNLPAYATCQFNPAVLTLLASSTSTPLTVPSLTTTLTVSVNQPPLVTPTSISFGGSLLLALLLFGFRDLRKSWRLATAGLAAVFLLALMTAGLTGCGSATSTTTKGTFPVTVTAVGTPSVPATAPTSSANNATASFTLNVTVQ